MKLVLFSDLHLTLKLDQSGRCSEEYLRHGLTLALETHDDATAVVILGDLTDSGLREEYHLLADCLSSVPLPVYLLLGNHDNRENYREVFGGKGFVEQSLRIGQSICHFLDTLSPGQAGGSINGGRLERLENELASANGSSLVFMHHPPIKTGLPAFDSDSMAELCAFNACIERRKDSIQAIFFGHCHMPVSGTLHGVPVFCVPALLEQSKPVFDRNVYRNNPSALPGYGLLVITGTDLIFHGISFDPPALNSREQPKKGNVHGVCGAS